MQHNEKWIQDILEHEDIYRMPILVPVIGTQKMCHRSIDAPIVKISKLPTQTKSSASDSFVISEFADQRNCKKRFILEIDASKVRELNNVLVLNVFFDQLKYQNEKMFSHANRISNIL